MQDSAPAVISFVKGHGTGNDFVLVGDHDGDLDLGPVQVARLADRHRGLGGDGVVRVVRSAALPEGAAALAEDAGAQWFMDYRNADGSLAQMCGNGVRVLAAHLLEAGLVDPALLDAPGGLPIGTRAGVKRVRRARGPQGQAWLASDLGRWRLVDPAAAASGVDARVLVAGLDVARPALSLDLGNPHTVVALASAGELAAADLTAPPAVDPLPLEGTNVELVVPADPVALGAGRALEHVGRLTMRVHERGAGETLSCGTGACAAVLAARTWATSAARSAAEAAAVPERWLVDVPGGQLAVRALPGERVELAGPAELVAAGTVSARWLLGGAAPAA